MAGYHLLPTTKEHDHNDDETATPSSIGPAAAKSKLRKYISALASFLLICIITLVAVVPTNHQVLPNEAAFAEDLSFLSTFSSTEHLPHSSSLIQKSPPYSSPRTHHQNLYPRRALQTETLARERRSMAQHPPKYIIISPTSVAHNQKRTPR